MMKRKRSKEIAVKKPDWLLRKRQGFRVLDPDGYQVPSCSHGPCLLFGRETEADKSERFFACAVYRSRRRCPFRMNISDEAATSDKISEESSISNTPTSTTFCYATVRRKVNLLKSEGEEIYYCSTCNDIFSLPHVHPLRGPVGVGQLRKPSQLLAPLTQNDSESQYWFTEESLSVIVNAVKESACDGVLCIGAPTVFEYFQSRKMLRQKYKSFLLDIDDRFVPFWRSSQFAVYSMLTNHFYEPKSITKLNTFFKSVHRLVMICDPPFGVFIEALMNSLRKLREQFHNCNISESNDYWNKKIIVLPVFVGKRFLDCSDLQMLDYRICYTNHPKYRRPEKSIVRLFTDLPLNAFDLSKLPDYRFCGKCEKYVVKTNLHCDLCGTCPSEGHSSYEHCKRCRRCVKSTYRHCTTCNVCHIPQRCPNVGSGDSHGRELLFSTTEAGRSKKPRKEQS